MTYLELVNATLRRLRRQEVASVASSSYSKLVGDLVNVAKREVEDSWNWLELMTTAELSIVSGTDTYTLTGFGGRYQINQVHDTTSPGKVFAISQERFRRWQDLVSTATTGTQVERWRIGGQSGGDPQIQFWPEPNSASTVKVYAKVAQADLSANTDELTVPDAPVLAGAYYRAIAERGEDGGTGSADALSEYQQALGDAIGYDNFNRAGGYESDWVVV